MASASASVEWKVALGVTDGTEWSLIFEGRCGGLLIVHIIDMSQYENTLENWKAVAAGEGMVGESVKAAKGVVKFDIADTEYGYSQTTLEIPLDQVARPLTAALDLAVKKGLKFYCK